MAKSTKDRSAKTAAKRIELDEKEVRFRCRKGGRDIIADLMAWTEDTEQASVIEASLRHVHSLGPDAVREALKPRHKMAISENVARAMEEFVPPADEEDDPQLHGTVHDPLYMAAINFVRETGRASVSATQRRLKIGYNRTARLVELMEVAGIITPMDSHGRREVIRQPETESMTDHFLPSRSST